MRLKTILLMSLIFPLIGFYSCKDSERGDETEIMAPAEKDMEQEPSTLTPENNNIIAKLKMDDELSTFTVPAGEALSPRMDQAEGPFTIFAPINTAYDRLEPQERIEMDAVTRKGNKELFEYYMVDGDLSVEWLKTKAEEQGGTYRTPSVMGKDLTFVLRGNDLVIKDPNGREAKVIGVDSTASNGRIYKIDNVLWPEYPEVSEEKE